MSNGATNIISFDGRGPGTYAEALLVQSHQKEAASRSAKFLDYGWSRRENVICSKTTKGILESVVNPNTMEVIHNWPSHRGIRRLVKVKLTGDHDMRSIQDWFGPSRSSTRCDIPS
jgi:hypothetical protein